MKKGNLYQYFILLFGFLLGVHNGYVALWSENSSAPVRVFPYAVTSLPPQDRQALERGIPIGEEAQLTKLLEDFLS